MHLGEEITVQRVAAARADPMPIVMGRGQDLRAHWAKEGPAFALLLPLSNHVLYSFLGNNRKSGFSGQCST